MHTIPSVSTTGTSAHGKRLLDAVTAEYGFASNMITAMAQCPPALEGYLHLNCALAAGDLASKLRVQIALAVAQTNECEYSLAQHSALARQLGMGEDEILASREARGVVLSFVRDLVRRPGNCDAADLLRAGYTDPEIVEIVGNVALNVYENYFNFAARPRLDFALPRIAASARTE